MTQLRRFDTPAGIIEALVDGEVVRARGIRYARAERFHPPVPEPPSTEPIEATHPSPACVQVVDEPGILRVDGLAGLEMSEDCLRVSVTLPADADPDAGLPVMVWIHGGAYRNGAADSPLHDPDALVVEHRVVVVNVGYRLGALGYLGAPGRPHNLGLLDQREALRWVQRNIAHLGGDPDQVTVFGESAGADAIAHLMISQDVITDDRPLFRRAIVQSAPLGTVRARELLAEAQASALTTLPADGALGSLLEVDTAVAASARRAGISGLMPYGVQYGRDPLPPATEAEATWQQVAPRIDLLAGTNAREVALYQDAPQVIRIRDLALIGPVLTEAAVTLLTRRVFERPTARFVERHQRAGGRARRYLFTGGVPGNRLRAAHAGELPYLFPTPGWAPSALLDGTSIAAVHRAGAGMRAMWASFARTGIADDAGATELLRLV
ncbi:MAG TPA: carboxylesterase/lipase family protein [Candidatus Avipropionibacterium avicola]|uniref:Carboxylesterase/lipase family protein n=1 Tax=Candidatus Avipropionibacterium avicola TaxID=2840701 RepID=A0A9D1H095_9ACTN|nr:carboxylesterase/lipase family protein [Candidatus Avipropionibacterium avicola]